jgi:hypothetical protein
VHRLGRAIEIALVSTAVGTVAHRLTERYGSLRLQAAIGVTRGDIFQGQIRFAVTEWRGTGTD